MGKLRVGNKQNSILNKEWAGHVRAWGKKFTAKTRRSVDKQVIREELKKLDNDNITGTDSQISKNI